MLLCCLICLFALQNNSPVIETFSERKLSATALRRSPYYFKLRLYGSGNEDMCRGCDTISSWTSNRIEKFVQGPLLSLLLLSLSRYSTETLRHVILLRSSHRRISTAATYRPPRHVVRRNTLSIRTCLSVTCRPLQHVIYQGMSSITICRRLLHDVHHDMSSIATCPSRYVIHYDMTSNTICSLLLMSSITICRPLQHVVHHDISSSTA